MTRQLCRGLPSDWWSTTDDGARLGMAICRRCPSQLSCPVGDKAPHGVVRAGAPFSDAGSLLTDCPTCGYPQPGDRVAQRDMCPRCEMPPLSRFRTDIEAWIAAGADNKTIAARVGATTRQVRDARQHWHKRTPKRARTATTGFKERSQRVVHERVDAAERMTRHGESAKTIAVRLDVTPRTVIRYRARLRQQHQLAS